MDGDGRVAEIEAPLPGCVVAARQIHTTRDPRVLAAKLRICGPHAMSEGGGTIECDGLVLASGRAPTLRVLSRRAPPVACAAYLDRGEWADASGVQPAAGRSVDVATQGPVCTMRAALTPATTPGEVIREPCSVETPRGGTHVVCPEAIYSFAGPKQALTTITVR
jgi:hypothetical protein